MDLSNLQEPLINIFRGYVHNFLVKRLLFNPHFLAYPPSPEYQKVFWKWAVKNLEQLPQAGDDEIDERLYEHSISLLQSTSTTQQVIGAQPPAPSYFTYIWPHDIGFEACTLKESRTTIEGGTTGLKTWRASLVLAQYLIQHPELVSGKSVLELGSGVGFLGLVIAAIQQIARNEGRITLTDVNPHVLSRCEGNIGLPCNRSSSHSDIRAQELDWTDALEDSRRRAVEDILAQASPHLIIGADVVFDPSIIPPLIATLEMALARDSATYALIALTVRNESTLADFTRQAENMLAVEQLYYATDTMEAFWGPALAGNTDHSSEVRIFLMRKKSKNEI